MLVRCFDEEKIELSSEARAMLNAQAVHVCQPGQ